MKAKCYLLLIVALVFITGCAGILENHKKITSQKEMFMAQSLSVNGAEVEVVTYWATNLNPKLNATDSALLYDLGIAQTSTSWKAVLASVEGKKLKSIPYYTIKFKLNGQYKLLHYQTRPLNEIAELYTHTIDHAGRRIYNSRGEMRYVGDWRDIEFSKHSDFLQKVKELNPREARIGTPEYNGIKDILKQFYAAVGMEMATAFRLEKGISFIIPLTVEDFERLDVDKKWSERFKKLAFDNWFVFFQLPLLTAAQYGASIVLSKVVQIPTLWWEDDLNKAGYMDRRNMTAGDTYDLIMFTLNQVNTAFSEYSLEEQAEIKRITGQDIRTYNEYLRWYHQKVKEIEDENGRRREKLQSRLPTN